MKLMNSVALVAAVLLIANSAVPNEALSWWSTSESSSSSSKVSFSGGPNKTDEVQKSANLQAQKDEEVGGSSTADQIADLDDDLEDDKPMKVVIEDDPNQEDVKTINSLSEQLPFTGAQNNTGNFFTYDRQPAQSEFVDRSQPHPTVSQGPDPRFANRQRSCQEGQYLCEKATPTQEHVRCIPNEWKCNGVRDCEQNDDEANCAINVHRVQPNSCHPDQYTCQGSGINGHNAQCVSRDKLCNGAYDCTYGDDEDRSRCPQYATRPQEEVSIPEPQPQPQFQPLDPRNIQHAPAQPQPQPQAQPTDCVPTRPEEYVKRLEWTDRCIRSCLANNRHK